jgi:hypothetical protein
MKMKQEKVYRFHPQDRKVAEGWEFANDLYGKQIASLAALIAKVRCRETVKYNRLRDAVANAGYDPEALLKSLRASIKDGTAFW